MFYLDRNYKEKRIKKIAIKMIQKAGLSDYITFLSFRISGGMKQRVSFIRALLSPQPVICLDEPFSALDELTRLDMQKWLLSIWEVHQTNDSCLLPIILMRPYFFQIELFFCLQNQQKLFPNLPFHLRGQDTRTFY